MILLVSLLQNPFRIDSVGFFTTGSISYSFCPILEYRRPDSGGTREGQPEVPKIPLLKSRFFIMWEGPFSSPGGWEDFSEAEPSRAGSKVTNLHEASRK